MIHYPLFLKKSAQDFSFQNHSKPENCAKKFSQNMIHNRLFQMKIKTWYVIRVVIFEKLKKWLKIIFHFCKNIFKKSDTLFTFSPKKVKPATYDRLWKNSNFFSQKNIKIWYIIYFLLYKITIPLHNCILRVIFSVIFFRKKVKIWYVIHFFQKKARKFFHSILFQR